MGISVYPPASAAGKTLKVQTFTTEGANTFTLPSGYGVGNPLTVELLLVGAGGASGSGVYQSATQGVVAGGGGGGGVKTITASITSNMTAHVGYRGYAGRGTNNYSTSATAGVYVGGNGGYTYFGNSTPKNLFLNPQLISPSNSEKDSFVFCGIKGDTTESSLNPAISGNIHYSDSWSDTAAIRKSQPYSVKPSTNYCFSIYMRPGVSQAATVLMHWYNSSNTFISTTTGSSTSITSGTWTRVHVGGTSPATAAYCVFRLTPANSSSGECWFSNVMFEEGATTPSTYVDGLTAGYSWAGHPAGSVTVSNSDSMYVASGGGGGGAMFEASTNYTGNRGNLGFPGASSGGGAVAWDTNTEAFSYGGSGGGAGGHASQKQDSYFSYTTNTNSYKQSTKSPFHNTFAENGFGALGNGYDTGANNMSRDTTVPGIGIDGYGRGGISTVSVLNGVLRERVMFESEDTMYAFVNAKPNTGNGGDARWLQLDALNTLAPGGNGGSGLIVVKYWE